MVKTLGKGSKMRVQKISNLEVQNGRCLCDVHLAHGYFWWKKEWVERWSRDKGFTYLWEDEDGSVQEHLGIKVTKLWKLTKAEKFL